MSKVELTVKANIIRVEWGGNPYVWDPDKKLDDLPYGTGRLIDFEDVDNNADDPWFIFYAEDCAFPTPHLIRAASWENAYEAFIDQEVERGHYVITEEEDPECWAELQKENGNPSCNFLEAC